MAQELRLLHLVVLGCFYHDTGLHGPISGFRGIFFRSHSLRTCRLYIEDFLVHGVGIGDNGEVLTGFCIGHQNETSLGG